MSTHYCINCPRCKRGCSICRRCACSDKELEEMFKPFTSPLVSNHDFLEGFRPILEPTEEAPERDKDEDQKPETD